MLDDLSVITEKCLLVRSERELPENIKTFSSKHKERSGRIINSDIVVFGNEKDFHKRNSDDEKIFQIASITKTFTAAALVKIMVDNPNDFDVFDPLSTKIAVFKDRLKPEAKSYFEKLEADSEFRYEDITLRHVLNHSSGIIHEDFSDKFRRDQTKEIRLCNETIPIKNGSNFGEFNYSDANYNYIIEPIIEAITGKNFADVVRDEIIKPCELEKTFMFDEMKYDKDENKVFVKDKPEIKVAQGYDYFDGEYISTQDFNYDSAAGGMYASVDDVAEFYHQLLNERIFKNQIKQKAFDAIFFKDENFIDSDKFKYGLGIRKDKHEEREYFLHSGSAYGFNSYVFGCRNLGDEKEAKICAAAISYENLTRDIATNLIVDEKKRIDGYFFIDDELRNGMEEVDALYSEDEIIYMRRKLDRINEQNPDWSFDEKSDEFKKVYINYNLKTCEEKIKNIEMLNKERLENAEMVQEDFWATKIRQEEKNKSEQYVR